MNSRYFWLKIITVAIVCSLPCLALQISATPASSPVSIPAKIILFAGVASGFVQFVKKFIPNLHGGVAVAFNVVVAIIGALSIASPADFKTYNFYIALATQIFATAGVHDLASFVGLFKTNGNK